MRQGDLSRGGRVLLKVKPPSEGRTNVQIVKPGEQAFGSKGAVQGRTEAALDQGLGELGGRVEGADGTPLDQQLA